MLRFQVRSMVTLYKVVREEAEEDSGVPKTLFLDFGVGYMALLLLLHCI